MPFRPWIFENDAEKVAVEKVITDEMWLMQYPEVSKKIKEGKLPRQGREESGQVKVPAGVKSSEQIAGQILAPAVAAANNA